MKIVFMGTPDFAVPILHMLVENGHDVALVVTQPDRPKGRKQVLTPPPVKVAAEKLGIPVFQPEKIKLEAEWTKVKEVGPELVVTAAFGQILPKELLEIPPKGCVNVHASLLPKYRGGAPIHQSVIDGEKETGITIMYMVEKLDAGDILAQKATPIEIEDTTGTMHEKLSRIGAELLKETLLMIEVGNVNPVAQDTDLVTFAPNIKKEQEIIDWDQNARNIFNQVRGLNPWPVAFTFVDDKRFKIWETYVDSKHTEQVPGTVIEMTSDAILVACGEGTVVGLTKVQPSGKKPMDVATFLRGSGNTWSSGMRLGDHAND